MEAAMLDRSEKQLVLRYQPKILMDRADPFPGIRKDANARRAFHLHS